MGAPRFLPAGIYGSAAVADAERRQYAPRFWHPLLPLDRLPEGQALALELLGLPLLLTHPTGGPRLFLNRCPHRAVALLAPAEEARPCRRLVCPYHGWTYDLEGRLQAAAREGDFLEPFRRDDWPLEELPLQVRAGLLWAAIGSNPLPLEQQLDLVLAEGGAALERPRRLLGTLRRSLACDWKIAHDNTLDDYHVAIAHPTTLHREQGPVRRYRHQLGQWANLLATPMEGGEFLTFGLPPWIHLLLWPDGRLALLQFPPESVGRCRMELWLLGDGSLRPRAGELLAELERFLEEDRRLVEAAQVGYGALPEFRPGPPHRLEQRIVHHQERYRLLMEQA
jgi:phenylpropionate dioxygenase-like ring-hydroxylating dioxygenase large terminal subunit